MKGMHVNQSHAAEMRNSFVVWSLKVYSDHRVQVSTSMILPEVILPHLNTSLLPIFLWSITGAEVEPVVHI